MAKGTSTTVGILNLNESGGLVKIGSGGLETSGDIIISTTGKGHYLKDSSGYSYPGVYDNGSNLWLGATATAAKHHRGSTYISSGYNGTSGNRSIFVSVPNNTNDNASNYEVFHTNNFNNWAVKLDGSNVTAGKTWGISISGNAATATNATNAANAANATLAATATKAKSVTWAYDRDTSNYKDIVLIYKADGTTVQQFIGGHNTPDEYTNPSTNQVTSGYIFINPQYDTGDRWNTTKGLVIGRTVLQFWNQPILHSGNYTTYTVKKDGTGASGTWGIGISGNAATATKVKNKLTINGKEYDGSAAINVGTIAVGHGGTGNTSFTAGTLVYASSATKLSSNGSATTSGSTITLTNSSTGSSAYTATNTNGAVQLLASTNRGVYDSTNSKWIVYTSKAADHTYIPLWASKGSSTKPVYFNSSGEPVACGSSLAVSVTGNAATASALTNLTTADLGSNTSTKRYVWFSYNDNVTGRPAYSANFTYQVAEGLLRVDKAISLADKVKLEYIDSTESLDFIFI